MFKGVVTIGQSDTLQNKCHLTPVVVTYLLSVCNLSEFAQRRCHIRLGAGRTTALEVKCKVNSGVINAKQ